MAEMNARKSAFETAIRSGKNPEERGDIKWSSADGQALEEEVEKAKRGLLFLCVKDAKYHRVVVEFIHPHHTVYCALLETVAGVCHLISSSVRTFFKGITKLSRLTGQEHSDIARILLGLVIDMRVPDGTSMVSPHAPRFRTQEHVAGANVWASGYVGAGTPDIVSRVEELAKKKSLTMAQIATALCQGRCYRAHRWHDAL